MYVIRALLGYRRAVAADLVAQRQQLDAYEAEAARDLIREDIAHKQEQLAATDRKLREALAADAGLARRAAIVQPPMAISLHLDHSSWRTPRSLCLWKGSSPTRRLTTLRCSSMAPAVVIVVGEGLHRIALAVQQCGHQGAFGAVGRVLDQTRAWAARWPAAAGCGRCHWVRR